VTAAHHTKGHETYHILTGSGVKGWFTLSHNSMTVVDEIIDTFEILGVLAMTLVVLPAVPFFYTGFQVRNMMRAKKYDRLIKLSFLNMSLDDQRALFMRLGKINLKSYNRFMQTDQEFIGSLTISGRALNYNEIHKLNLEYARHLRGT